MDFAKARGRREHFIDAHRLRRGLQAVERMIAIVEQIARRFVPRKGLAELLGRPRRRRMRVDRYVPNASPILATAYYGVRTNGNLIAAFRAGLPGNGTGRCAGANGGRLSWARMRRYVARWFPRTAISHAWPAQRFDARARGKSPVR
jgi:hypothetical protein